VFLEFPRERKVKSRPLDLSPPSYSLQARAKIVAELLACLIYPGLSLALIPSSCLPLLVIVDPIFPRHRLSALVGFKVSVSLSFLPFDFP
jgi:hypothetical protein